MVPNIGKIQRSGPARAARPAGILTNRSPIILEYTSQRWETLLEAVGKALL